MDKKRLADDTAAPALLQDEKMKKGYTAWQDNVLANRVGPDGQLRREFKTRYGQVEKTKAEFKSGSGEITIKSLYTPLDMAQTDPVEDIGFPGSFPFTRGRDPLGPQAAVLPMKFYSGFGGSRDAKERYKALYAAGGKYISIAFDLPTQLGYDSDSSQAKWEVGKVGVALDTLKDLEDLFDGLPLEDIRTGTVGNCIGPWAFALFYLLGARKKIRPQDMQIVLQNDPIKEYTGRGTYIFSPQTAIDLASDVVVHVCRHLPFGWQPQFHCTTQMRWGGCTASQEIAFGIADLIAYVEAAQKKGVAPEDLIPRLDLHMTCDNDLFEEVAKFRAARRVFAKVFKKRFSTDDPRILSLRLTVWTGSHRLTAQQPLNNIIRSTMHSLASLLGGVETISVPAHDEALALPTTESTRLAALTPLLLKEECMVCNTADPLAGSYYVEDLTNRLEEKSLYWLDQVEQQGGAVACVESGYYLKRMSEEMLKYKQEVENNTRTVIGVNQYVVENEPPIELFEGDPESERRQIEKLAHIRKSRNRAAVQESLDEVRRISEKKASGKDANIVPAMLKAVDSYATIGEIFGILREVFGEYKPPSVF